MVFYISYKLAQLQAVLRLAAKKPRRPLSLGDGILPKIAKSSKEMRKRRFSGTGGQGTP
jgi:hypothetical protein